MSGRNTPMPGEKTADELYLSYGHWLVETILDVARRCYREDRPHPYALVIDLDKTSQASAAWNAVGIGPCDIVMEIASDQGSKDKAVLLFYRPAAADGERARAT